eukprot:UN05393
MFVPGCLCYFSRDCDCKELSHCTVIYTTSYRDRGHQNDRGKFHVCLV